MLGKLITGTVFLTPLLGSLAYAQSPRDSAIRATAINRAVKEYRNYIGMAAPLYAGPKYTDYSRLIEKDQPFFINKDFHPGSVLFDHILYDRVQLRLDLLTNRLILVDPIGNIELVPDPEKIEAFTISNHYFIKLHREPGVANAPSPGYYEVLFEGNGLTVLRRENKTLRKNLDGPVVTRYILTDADYYLRKGNVYHSINKKSQLLEVLKDRKKELQNFIKNKDLDFDEDKDNAIKTTLQYYQALHKS